MESSALANNGNLRSMGNKRESKEIQKKMTSLSNQKGGSDDLSSVSHSVVSTRPGPTKRLELLTVEEDCKPPASSAKRTRVEMESPQTTTSANQGMADPTGNRRANMVKRPSVRWKAPTLNDAEEDKPSTLSKARVFIGNIVDSALMQWFILLLITVNAIMLGLGTFDFITEDDEAQEAFQVVDRGFLIVFTVELVCQLFYRGPFFFADGWLLFDLIIVVTSWTFTQMQICRAFRIFRGLRIVTRIDQLRNLVVALGDVMPKIYVIGMLLLLVFYIYGVLFTTLFGDLELSQNYFDTLPNSLFTCMELMTLEWAGIAREVMHHRPWAWGPLVSFIFISGFIAFNLIVAVVCNAVAVVEEKFREEQFSKNLDKPTKQRMLELSRQVRSLRKANLEMSRYVAVLTTDWERKTAELQSLRHIALHEQGRSANDLSIASVASDGSHRVTLEANHGQEESASIAQGSFR